MTAPFSVESAKPVLQEACRRAGLSGHDAELMRFGENALFHLPSEGVVVRIARTMDYYDDVVREVAVSQWLYRAGLRVAEAVEEIQQPLAVDGYPVTIWHFIDGAPAPYARIGDLGALLHHLHTLTPPAELALPEQNILGRVRPRVEHAPIEEADRAFLLTRLDELHDEVASLEYVLQPGAVHGDAHIKNLMISTTGNPVLIDFERFGYGQPEWDLGMTATEYCTAGWWTSQQYQAFVEGYGVDVTQWPGFATVQAVHQLKMTTWIMQNVLESQDIADEYHARMQTIRDGKPSVWAPR